MDHNCVFCTAKHQQLPVIRCRQDAGAGSLFTFVPAGEPILFGQMTADGKFHVTIHEDMTGEEIGNLMTAFMDTISRFDHIKNDPSVIMQAIMKSTGG